MNEPTETVRTVEVNPSGKLPITFARSQDHYPPWDITSTEVDYGYFHGYRLLDENDHEPEFPFGFGRSYTEFQLSSLALDRNEAGAGDRFTVSVDVRNAGERTGDEVVQVYVGHPGSPVERPVRQLRAFTRVSLEPGETKTVELPIPVAELAYYDEASKAWVVAPGERTIWVGSHSRDLALSDTLVVE